MIQVEGLSFSYNSSRAILDQIAFDAGETQCIAILGNNGAGKSTLIKCLNRILEPRQGVVHVNGKELHHLKRKDIAKHMAYVSQKSTGDQFTVFDSILLGRKPYIKFEPSRKDIEIIETVIERMDLSDYAMRYVDELSGGELQKVMLARALAQQPQVLLLDEPTSNLDLRNQYEMLALVRNIAKEEKISVIIVIHDLNLALRYCDKFLFVKDSRVFAYGGNEIMTADNIGYVYGIAVSVEMFQGIPVVIPIPVN